MKEETKSRNCSVSNRFLRQGREAEGYRWGRKGVENFWEKVYKPHSCNLQTCLWRIYVTMRAK